MIFASDLDRTLIYSKNFLKPELLNIKVVETKDDIDLSHMTEKAVKLLGLINEKVLFIPTTTRSQEQYNRISIFRNLIQTKYAVVANGGIILKNNKPDRNWTDIITKQQNMIISPDEMIQECGFFLKSEEINSYRCCDNLFIYAVIKANRIDTDKFAELKHIACKRNYRVTLNGRKIYIIPEFLNKWEPLKYIMNLEKETEIFTAGDSLLDLPMLSNSNYGFIPLHGELFKLYKSTIDSMNNLHFTNKQGISSSEEFLEDILRRIS